jgi:hypothetical protein
MRITKRQLRRIIKEELLQEYGHLNEVGRNEPGHRDPESGNWVDPGTPGYNPMKDKTLTDGGWGEAELSKAKTAHKNAAGYMGPQIDKSWKHPAFR